MYDGVLPFYRANAQQPKLFVGMILILIFAEALALYGLIGKSYCSVHASIEKQQRTWIHNSFFCSWHYPGLQGWQVSLDALDATSSEYRHNWAADWGQICLTILSQKLLFKAAACVNNSSLQESVSQYASYLLCDECCALVKSCRASSAQLLHVLQHNSVFCTLKRCLQ